MYFCIETLESDPQFSWILSKHPANIFEREYKQGRLIARFLSETGRVYQGWFVNDPIALMRALRDVNQSQYVHFQLSGVCPNNLRAFEQCFRSTILGKVSEPLSKEAFFAKKKLRATLGPYPWLNEVFFKEVWRAFDIEASPIEEGDFNAKMWQFSGEMSVTEFLQKLYLLSYYFTQRYALQDAGKDVIEKFAKRCVSWFMCCESNRIKSKILKRLCRYDSKLEKVFRVTLEDASKDENDVRESFRNMETWIDRKHPTLHVARHLLIVDHIIKYRSNKSPDDQFTVLDWGMGDAKLLRRLAKKLDNLDNVELRGIDADAKRVAKAKGRYRGKFRTQNLLYPCEVIHPTVLVHCEVIEHLNATDRHRALWLMRDFYQPEMLILTTPNFEHNVNWDGLVDEDGTVKYRHGGHQIEYTEVQFIEEVERYLARDYDVERVDVIDLDEYKPRTDDVDDEKTLHVFNQPTFMIVCRRKTKRQTAAINQAMRMYHSVPLAVNGIEISEKELEAGFANAAMIGNAANITHLGPTVPPVPYNAQFPEDLEHPMTAIQYYAKRGVSEVFIEKKFMGSRATVLVFKTEEIANFFGFETPVVVTSRTGFPFFRKEDETEQYAHIYRDIGGKLKGSCWDYVMLDCEIMPWSYKGRRLIQDEFRLPGEAALLFRQYAQQPGIEHARRYLEVLDHYSQDQPLHFQMFQLLLKGSVHRDNGGKLQYPEHTVLGSLMHRTDMYRYLESLQTTFFQFERGVYFNLQTAMALENQQASVAWLSDYWQEVTQEYEGVVIKPARRIELPSGYWVQPMLKARGMPYLRLIYGIDIDDPAYFAQITDRRSLKAKRLQAIVQHELADMMLRAFYHNNPTLRQRLVAAFLGHETLKFHNLDRTL